MSASQVGITNGGLRPARPRRFRLLSALCLLAVAVPPIVAAPPDFQSEIRITGLQEPTGLTFTPDGRMLIIERGGRIHVVLAGATQVEPTPFHTIPNVEVAGGESGLVGITVDPAFASNGFYYVFYTAMVPLRDRVSRFTAAGNVTLPASEVVIWQENVTADQYHHGGTVAFGPDGRLYISTGDGFSSASSQDLTSYNGKILRINADGTVPSDNPFVDGPGPNLEEIWALGLRNPFRFAFDSLTGRMYIADVGSNSAADSIEEVNLGIRGANYGWPFCEGTCGDVGMTNPIFSYPHAGRDASITGGFVYRGTQFPAEYAGSYFYGDYVRNWIRRLTFDALGNVTGDVPFEPADGSNDGPYGEIVDIKQGPDGALYYVDIGISWDTSGVRPGNIYRIRYTAVDQPPVAVATANPTSGPPPLSVAFSSAGSVDPEGQPLSFLWTFGDGQTSTDADPVHVYQQSGPYTARLEVSDGARSTLSSPISIRVGTPPVASIAAPLTGTTFRAGDAIAFSGGGTDAEDGTLPPAALSWTVLLHHETHFHPALGPLPGVPSGVFPIPTSGHDFSGNVRYEIVLTVTDSTGLQDATAVTILPQKVDLTFSTSPAGLSVTLDGIPRATPFVHDTLVGFEHAIVAPNQSQGGTQYTFTAWSDGGAQAHTIVVPSTATAYQAAFQAAAGPAGRIVAYGLDEGSGATVADASGNGNTATIVGATWTPSGRYGAALSFDAVNDRVAGPAIALPAAFTLMAWVFNPANTPYETILTIGNTRDFYLANGVLSFYHGVDRTFGPAISTNAWHHVTLASNGASLQVYVDGAPQGAAQSASLPAVTAAVQLGAWINGSSNSDFFGGLIDEVQVYNRRLTQDEIVTAMNTAIGSGGSTDTVPPVRSNGQPAGTLPSGTTDAVLSLDTNEAASCRYSTTAGVPYASMTSVFSTTGATSHATAVTGLVDGGAYSFFVRCQDTAGNANTDDFSIAFSVATAPPPAAGPFLAYGFNTGSGMLAGDASGAGNHGLISGATWTTQGRYGSALTFDGFNDRVTGPTLTLGTTLTYTAWIFNPSNATNEAIVTVGIQREVYLRSGRVRFYSGVDRVFGGPLLATNTWHHVAVVYDGSTLRAYVNGTPYGSALTVALGGVSGAVEVGSRNARRFFGGRIDQVRIYPRALSQAEIVTDLNTPIVP